jgi:hypothetical protein
LATSGADEREGKEEEEKGEDEDEGGEEKEKENGEDDEYELLLLLPVVARVMVQHVQRATLCSEHNGVGDSSAAGTVGFRRTGTPRTGAGRDERTVHQHGGRHHASAQTELG